MRPLPRILPLTLPGSSLRGAPVNCDKIASLRGTQRPRTQRKVSGGLEFRIVIEGRQKCRTNEYAGGPISGSNVRGLPASPILEQLRSI